MLSENPSEVNGCGVSLPVGQHDPLRAEHPPVLVFIVAFIAPELISGARLICIGYPLAGVIRVVACAIAVATCMIYFMNYARYGYEIIMNSVSALLIMAPTKATSSRRRSGCSVQATSDGGAIKNPASTIRGCRWRSVTTTDYDLWVGVGARMTCGCVCVCRLAQRGTHAREWSV